MVPFGMLEIELLSRVVEAYEENLEREWQIYNERLRVETWALCIGRKYGINDEDSRIISYIKWMTPRCRGDIAWPFAVNGPQWTVFVELVRILHLNTTLDVSMNEDDWTEWIESF